MTRRSRAELALAGVTVIWGSTFVIVKDALAEVSPLVFIALRFTLALAALAWIYRTPLRATGKIGLRGGAIAGVLLFGGYFFQTAGLELTTPSKSAFLTSLSIPMVPLASSLVYRNKPRLSEVIGILVASFGMILMSFPSAFDSGRLEMSRGDFLSFLCAVLFALHLVVIGHYSPLAGFRPVAVIQVGVAAALGWSAFWFVGLSGLTTQRFHLSAGVAIALLVTGLLATAVAFTTMAWAQQYTSPTRSALIFALEPVVAWITSWILTGETMANRGKVGAGLDSRRHSGG